MTGREADLLAILHEFPRSTTKDVARRYFASRSSFNSIAGRSHVVLHALRGMEAANLVKRIGGRTIRWEAVA